MLLLRNFRIIAELFQIEKKKATGELLVAGEIPASGVD